MNKKLLGRYTVPIVIFYVFSAASLAVASFRDLQIDIALNNTRSFVANWFAETGEMPTYLLLVLATAFLGKCMRKKFPKALCSVFCLGAGGYLGDYISRRLFEDNEFRQGFGIIFGINIAVAVLLAVHFIDIPKKYRKPVIAMAIIGLCVCGLEAGMVSILKAFWGRVRFRDLDAAYSQFTAWYVINGNNGNHSFPSGHTGSAGMSYMIMILPYISKKLEKNYLLCFGAAFCYTSVVAATRLVMGAHYLSDVAAGGVIAFTMTLIGIKIYEILASRDFSLRSKKTKRD